MPPAICMPSLDARNANSLAYTLHAAVSSEKSIPPRSIIPLVTCTAESAAYVSTALVAIFLRIISNDPIDRPNCWRSLAYLIASRMMRRAPRAEPAASPSRPEFRTSSATWNPCPTSPSRSSTGTFTFSKNTPRVSLALIPIFSSSLPSLTPGAWASTMKAVTRCFCLPSISMATCANTVKMSAYPAFEIQIFWPLST